MRRRDHRDRAPPVRPIRKLAPLQSSLRALRGSGDARRPQKNATLEPLAIRAGWLQAPSMMAIEPPPGARRHSRPEPSITDTFLPRNVPRLVPR